MRRNALMQLLASNRQTYKPMQQRVQQGNADEATIYVYDAIVGDRMTAEWYGGVCPQDFVPALAALDVGTIHLRINSPGGDVFAAESMCQALREHKATIITHIDGLAASAATAMCCASDEVIASRNSKYMIHQAWTMAWGNADDLRQVIELLDKCDAGIIDEYVRFTGRTPQQITDWVRAETWFTAAEAVDAKFVHRIADGAAPPADTARSQAPTASAWDLSAYAHAPQDTAPATQDHRARQQQRLRMLTALNRIV